MAFKTYTVLTLLVASSAAFAWRPVTYPIRSQSPYERSIDNAMCYAEAARVSKVDIRREPQIPPRPAPAAKGASTGAPPKPPLPQSSFSATPLPYGASTSEAVSEPMAGVGSARSPITVPADASAAATNTAAGASAEPGASGAPDASLQANAASDVKLPPLPAPEPPMTRYWAAYAACMQARGYVVQ
ncbi:hypothetical protein [Paraburkholderia sp. HP33-1]|uniref:hypothetical protein n=1 Tax=Paraburkholderia sp. HP33-1 TaxID=2883243 RepID=UPI001F2D729E|nr:hypothetical protein [Paraburkholderia sp. HP33-1]